MAVKLLRRHDWPEQLHAFIESRRDEAFAWGANDCALFAADCILALTGADLAECWRGYETERRGLEIIRNIGGMRAVALSAGLVEVPVAFAQRGDLVIASLEGREAFGIVSDGRNWCGPGKYGIEFRPMAGLIAAYRV